MKFYIFEDRCSRANILSCLQLPLHSLIVGSALGGKKKEGSFVCGALEECSQKLCLAVFGVQPSAFCLELPRVFLNCTEHNVHPRWCQ